MKTYTNIHTIFTKLYRDYNLVNLDEATVVEWVAEALSAIHAVPDLEQVVKFFAIKNYQVKIPCDLVEINQIITLRHGPDVCRNLTALCSEKPEYFIRKSTEENTCEDTANKSCTDIVIRFTPETKKVLGIGDYRTVRKSSSTFASMSDCSDNYQHGCDLEYTVIKGEILRFNFTDAIIAMSYMMLPIDDEGYPLIPNDYSHITAVTKYIVYKYLEKQYYFSNDIPINKYQFAKKEWEDYCGQAASASMIPSGVDSMENLAQMWLKPIYGRDYESLFTELKNTTKLTF